jgi:hypothetical protein
MEKISRRLESVEQERPLWRRPLPVALLSVLLAMGIAKLFRGSATQNATRPGVSAPTRSSEPGETAKSVEEPARWATTQKELAEKQAGKLQEEILSGLRKNGLLGNAPAGEQPATPVPPPPEASISPGKPRVILAQLAPRPWTSKLNQGELVGQQFVDGGLALQNAPIPADLAGRVRAGSVATIQLEINSAGRVYKGQRLAGDRGLAKALIRAAKDGWQFNPPRVNGVAVRVATAVNVQF